MFESSSSKTQSRLRGHGGLAEGPLASRAQINQNSICFILMFATATSWLMFEHTAPLNSISILPGVQATLWPKARICFNSMASSFQSECVYCDSRLYASTITACTGQPVLANNITQAQAFCIATACLQQTGKQPTVLGRRRRRRRSLQFRPLALGATLNTHKNKPSYYSLSPSGNVTAQFDKSMNGTTSGNLAFVLNRPAQALWLNPLSRVLIRNSTNKNLQWQFGKTTANVLSGRASPAPATPATAAGPPPRPAAPAAPARPVAPAAPTVTTVRPAAPAGPPAVGG